VVTLLVAGRDGAVHAIDTRLESWIDRACDAAGRNLTHDEWAEAIGDRPTTKPAPLAPSERTPGHVRSLSLSLEGRPAPWATTGATPLR
jgi:hypothetical protein